MILIRRLRAVIAHDKHRIIAAPHKMRCRGITPLHGLGDHGGHLTREIRRHSQGMGIVEIEHQCIDRQIGDRPVNPFEPAYGNGIGIGERPMQVPRLGVDFIDIEGE